MSLFTPCDVDRNLISCLDCGADRKASPRRKRAPVDTEAGTGRCHRREQATSERNRCGARTGDESAFGQHSHAPRARRLVQDRSEALLRGAAHEVPFANDAVLCFEHKQDA